MAIVNKNVVSFPLNKFRYLKRCKRSKKIKGYIIEFKNHVLYLTGYMKERSRCSALAVGPAPLVLAVHNFPCPDSGGRGTRHASRLMWTMANDLAMMWTNNVNKSGMYKAVQWHYIDKLSNDTVPNHTFITITKLYLFTNRTKITGWFPVLNSAKKVHV